MAHDRETEDATVQRMLDGDEDAFRDLYRAIQPGLLRYLTVLVGVTDAEDVRQSIRIILETVEVPVIVDAGVGTASDAAIAMELGCHGVLMNTAIAHAKDPVLMATAMRDAVRAGRMARLAGRMAKTRYANASSPTEGLIE